LCAREDPPRIAWIVSPLATPAESLRGVCHLRRLYGLLLPTALSPVCHELAAPLAAFRLARVLRGLRGDVSWCALTQTVRYQRLACGAMTMSPLTVVKGDYHPCWAPDSLSRWIPGHGPQSSRRHVHRS